ncbi:hypothetical protein Tco_0458424 [Tanacetum coccineum]
MYIGATGEAMDVGNLLKPMVGQDYLNGMNFIVVQIFNGALISAVVLADSTTFLRHQGLGAKEIDWHGLLLLIWDSPGRVLNEESDSRFQAGLKREACENQDQPSPISVLEPQFEADT